MSESFRIERKLTRGLCMECGRVEWGFVFILFRVFFRGFLCRECLARLGQEISAALGLSTQEHTDV